MLRRRRALWLLPGALALIMVPSARAGLKGQAPGPGPATSPRRPPSIRQVQLAAHYVPAGDRGMLRDALVDEDEGEAARLAVSGSVHRHFGRRAHADGEPASTTGRLYHLPMSFPALKLGGRDPVYGQAMTFPGLEATLERLDLLEGYAPDDPQGSMYLRRVRPVTLLDSKKRIHAYCYVWYVWRGRLPGGARHLPFGMWAPRRTQ